MTKYLIVGSGRWAHHLERILCLSGQPFTHWNRQAHTEDQLFAWSNECSHLWLAISDRALEEWAQKLAGSSALLIHSSGALEIPGVQSVHPLMSFGPHLYEDAFYPQIGFVTTSDLPKQKLIPGLPQSLTQISPEKKTFYHAMCVLAGNGSVVLWQKFFQELKNLGIPETAGLLYHQQISKNIQTHLDLALTGPLVRNDRKTLLADLRSLEEDPFQAVLQALIQAFHQTQTARKPNEHL